MTPLPRLTAATAALMHEADVLDEFGATRRISIPAERALTVFVDNRELVTLMTLGAAPELLVLGVAVSAGVGALLLAAQQVAYGSLAAWLAWGVGMFVVGWVIQFVGHWYEGRKPAFVDDMIGLLVGPMFVTAEAMFMLGWNKPLLAEIERRAGPTHLRDLARIV